MAPVHDGQTSQTDLFTLFGWSNKWKMKFNFNKYKNLPVSRLQSPVVFNYLLYKNLLERECSFTDLDITVHANLKWDIHIDQIVSNANVMLRYSDIRL